MSEKLPEKMVRVEYDLPPLRAIMSTWYEDFADNRLGTGPTLAVALLDAVRRARGMKEKT